MQSHYFNSLMHHVLQGERYNMELSDAKAEFEEVAGPIFVTDRGYDARINSFHNWYILDRPLRSNGKTPLAYFIEFNANALGPKDLEGYVELGRNIHAVFELSGMGKTQTNLINVLDRRKYKVEGVEDTANLDRGALFNGRIFMHGDQYFLSNYFILHPAEVARRIRRAAKQVRKHKADTKAFLLRLLLFQSRWEQYKQMDVHNIYRLDEA